MKKQTDKIYVGTERVRRRRRESAKRGLSICL